MESSVVLLVILLHGMCVAAQRPCPTVLFEKTDVNQDGKIDFNEFKSCFTDQGKHGITKEEFYTVLLDYRFDTCGLDKGEVFRTYSKRTEEINIDNLFHEQYDLNSDETISSTEFLAVYYQMLFKENFLL